jgi:hypothetical protein
MQAMWYEVSQGDSWRRQGQFGRALKQYLQVDKVQLSHQTPSLIAASLHFNLIS